jgi:hypothetical protein
VTHDWLGEMRYAWLVREAHLKVEELKERGGGHVGFASVAEKLIRTHQPKRRRTGSPCRACSEPWPCTSFRIAWGHPD